MAKTTVPIELSSTPSIVDNGDATAITIDSSENVGIGRTPNANGILQLNVATGNNCNITLAENSTDKWLIGNVTSSDAFRIYDFSNAAERLRIDSSGNVGIGTSSPSAALHIASGTEEPLSWGSTDAGYNYATIRHHSSGDIAYYGACGGGAITAGTSSDFGLRANQGSMLFATNGNNERMRIDNYGVIQLTRSTASSFINANSSPALELDVNRHPENGAFGSSSRSHGRIVITGADGGSYITFNTASANNTVASERMRIDSSGNFLVAKTASNIAASGFQVATTGQTDVTVSGSECMNINRETNDGDLIRFRQANTIEGSISVSGTTVSYNGGHLSRWSQLADNTKDETIVKGTVMTNLNQMAEWTTDGVTEDNEQLNCMAVSSVEGDVNVAGVFVNWDNDDEVYTADMNVAMTGDMVIRIAQGVTVAQGDLLMSAGDGTAKPQDDDIIRAKTIAKVTSTHVSHTYDDGSYLVPCVLMAC